MTAVARWCNFGFHPILNSFSGCHIFPFIWKRYFCVRQTEVVLQFVFLLPLCVKKSFKLMYYSVDLWWVRFLSPVGRYLLLSDLSLEASKIKRKLSFLEKAYSLTTVSANIAVHLKWNTYSTRVISEKYLPSIFVKALPSCKLSCSVLFIVVYCCHSMNLRWRKVSAFVIRA